MKRLVLDVDNTLTIGRDENYLLAQPDLDAIARLRSYKEQGFEIVLYTSRNMKTFKDNIGKINALTLPILVEWLTKHDIPFDEIYVGKPWCGTEGFYVDDKAIRPDEFKSLSYDDIRELIKCY